MVVALVVEVDNLDDDVVGGEVDGAIPTEIYLGRGEVELVGAVSLRGWRRLKRHLLIFD